MFVGLNRTSYCHRHLFIYDFLDNKLEINMYYVGR